MKNRLFRFLLVVGVTGCGVQDAAVGQTPGQTGSVAPLDISQGWKFRIGDDSKWSEATWDDAGWEIIELGKPGKALGGEAYDGYAWYRAKLYIPAHFKDSADFRQGRRLLLTLGWINAVDETWFNGTTVGQTGSFDMPRGKRPWAQQRVYEIPEQLVLWGGENFIAIRVYDPEGKGATWRETATLSIPTWQRFFTLDLGTRSEDGIFHDGEWMQVHAVITNKTFTTLKGSLVWTIATDEQNELKKTSIPFTIEPGQEKQRLCPLYELPGPGFYRVTCTFQRDSDPGSVTDWMNVGHTPLKIDHAMTREADFDAFWKIAMQELQGVDPQYKLTLQKEADNEKRDLYLVEMKSLGGLMVRGWYEVPKKPGKHPAILKVPGYGGSARPENKFGDMVVLSFNIRSHGDSDEAPGAPMDMWLRGLDNEREYYYRGAYMDCIRAVDFLTSRPEVDHDRIAVWGGSQGGGLSLATAALDRRISFCMADVPWLCDWVQYFKTSHWDEIDEWLAADPGRSWKSMLRTLSYFDTMNMTDRITCPVVMAIGLQDQVCPPSTSFASFNRIRTPKEYQVYIDAGHRLPRHHWDSGYERLRVVFGLAP